MHKRGRSLENWIAPRDLVDRVVPELNAIWASAGIRFELERVSTERALEPPDRKPLLETVTTATATPRARVIRPASRRSSS